MSDRNFTGHNNYGDAEDEWREEEPAPRWEEDAIESLKAEVRRMQAVVDAARGVREAYAGGWAALAYRIETLDVLHQSLVTLDAPANAGPNGCKLSDASCGRVAWQTETASPA